ARKHRCVNCRTVTPALERLKPFGNYEAVRKLRRAEDDQGDYLARSMFDHDVLPGFPNGFYAASHDQTCIEPGQRLDHLRLNRVSERLQSDAWHRMGAEATSTGLARTSHDQR